MFLEKNIPIEGGSGFPVGCACPKQVITKWAIVCHERSHAEGENYNEDNAKYWVKTFEAIESPSENRPGGFQNVFAMIDDAYKAFNESASHVGNGGIAEFFAFNRGQSPPQRAFFCGLKPVHPDCTDYIKRLNFMTFGLGEEQAGRRGGAPSPRPALARASPGQSGDKENLAECDDTTFWGAFVVQDLTVRNTDGGVSRRCKSPPFLR